MTSVQELLNLSGQTILVTGATGTIGQAICLRLAEAGAQVICHYRSQQQQAQALAEHLDNGALAVHGDLTSDVGVAALTEHLESQGLLMHGLVNNAADQSVGMLAEMTMPQWQAVLRTNLDSVFQLSQWMIGRLQAAGTGGSIVNISSIEGADPRSK